MRCFRSLIEGIPRIWEMVVVSGVGVWSLREKKSKENKSGGGVVVVLRCVLCAVCCSLYVALQGKKSNS